MRVSLLQVWQSCVHRTQLSLIEQRVALALTVHRYHMHPDWKSNLTISHPLFVNIEGVFVRFAARAVSARQASPLVSKALTKGLVLSYPVWAHALPRRQAQAQRFEDGLDDQTHPFDVLASDSQPPLPKAEEGMVLVVTCTYSNLPPENAEPFASRLNGTDAASKLQGVIFSVFRVRNSQ